MSDASGYGFRMDFSHDELRWLNNALNEVLHGPESIEEREFHTRMGGEREEVEALLAKVRDALRAD